jgi:MFS family permease
VSAPAFVDRVVGRFSQRHAAFAGIFVVTLLGLMSVGATLPVLPRYVKGPIGAGDVAVGIVTGAFAITGLACRPLAGHFADARGRKPAVLIGALLTATAGALYFVPAGIPGLIVARLFLGAGEGMVYTAGSAWVVDLAPPGRRGRVIGLYGLAIWGGLSIGPLIGTLILHASDSFDLVWAFAMVAPLIGALIALRIPEVGRVRRRRDPLHSGDLIARESLRPGLALSLGTVGYATMAAFIVLFMRQRGIGHGAEAFAAFAGTVVLMRIVGGDLPDRFGPVRCAVAAGLTETVGLVVIGLAGSLGMALAGSILMGAAFSLLFPSLALLVVDAVPEERRGSAMGTFTAFFDLGVGVGGPLAGIAAAIGGYESAFLFASCFGVMASLAAIRAGRLARLALATPARAATG